MEIVIGDYRISPYAGGTCWQIQRRNNGGKSKGKREWCDPRKFPSNLAHALRLVREQMIRENVSSDTSDLEKAISDIETIDRRFSELVGDLELRPKDME